MTDYVNEYLAEAKAKEGTWVVEHMRCADGTTLSVQASKGHYSKPHSDTGPWTHVEVWCIVGPKGNSVRPTTWAEWYNGRSEPYSYVPIEKVNAFIKRHGGLAS
jgi:hypothetical protein